MLVVKFRVSSHMLLLEDLIVLKFLSRKTK